MMAHILNPQLNPKVPSVGAMFENGIPSIETLQAVIKDIDQQLDDNANSLEEKMHIIMEATNDMSGNLYISPREAVEQLNQCALMERAACMPPEPEDVSRLLRKILQTLAKYPGCEEDIFRNLLKLSSHEGIAIPIRAAPSELGSESTVSINAVTDNAEEMNEALWDDIRLRLRRSFYEKLQALPVTSNPESGGDYRRRRVECLQSLCVLYPFEEVWRRYRSIRVQQFECILSDNLPKPEADEEQEVKLGEVAPAFCRVAEGVKCMISDDYEVLMSGVFNNSVETFAAIQEMYLDRLSLTVGDVVDRVWIVLSQGVDQSREGSLQNGTAVRTSGTNGPTAKDEGGEGHEESKLFSPSDMECLVRLISAVSGVDAFVDDHHRMASWSPVLGIKPNRTKERLRGVLKHNIRDHDKDKAVYSKERESYAATKYALLPDAIPPPFGVTQAMLGEDSSPPGTPPTVRKIASLDKPKWEWCGCCEKLIPSLAKSLTALVDATTHRALTELIKLYENEHTIEMVPVCDDLIGGKGDYPRRIAKSCATVIKTLDSLLPLAVAASDSMFQQIRSAFTEAIIGSFRLFYEKLTKISGDVPETSPIICLYMTLSTASFIRSHLVYYEKILGEDSRHVLSINQKLFSDLIDLISRNIMEYQNHIIATVVLQDAESHNWTDARAFYEDERCSFAVQMWNYHIRGLQHDLFTNCPPHLAQSMFLSILNESLTILVQRYSKAKPSYNRVKQLRSDVTTILLSTSDFLWSCSNSVGKLLDPVSSNTHSSIHNLCTCLLSTMVVVASPLNDLYKAYKKGFHKKKSSASSVRGPEKEGQGQGHITQWMSWLRPGLFEGQPKNLDSVQDKMAAHILLKLASSQPTPNFVLVLQALLMKDAFLPVFLVTHADPTQSQASTESLISSESDQGCQGVCCPGNSCVSFESRDIPDCVQPIVDVLVLCKNQPIALSNVLMAMIEKDDNWEIFESSCIPGKSAPVPAWLESVYEAISPFVERIIKSVMQILIVDGSKGTVPSFSEIVKELPCGCKPESPERLLKHHGPKDPLFSAIRGLIVKLTEEIPTMPTPLCVFFKHLQTKLQEMDIKTAHNCVALQIIASCFFNKLQDRESLTEMMEEGTPSVILDALFHLSDCIYPILTTAAYGNKSNMSKFTHIFLKVHCDWLPRHIETIISHLRNDAYSEIEAYSTEGIPMDFMDYYLTIQSHEICNTIEGEKSLLQVYHILRNNVKWFEHNLGIPPLLASKESSPVEPVFSLDLPNQDAAAQFNPFGHFGALGDVPLGQEAIAEFAYDWPKILLCDLGLSELGFRNLLSHRYEMQENAYIEEADKKPVTVLKAKFDLDPEELV